MFAPSAAKGQATIARKLCLSSPLPSSQPPPPQDYKTVKVVASLAMLLVRHFRRKRLTQSKLLRLMILKYVSASGGWKRAFPSSIDGNVAVPFHFDLNAKASYWVEEHMRLPRGDIDRVRILLGIPDYVVTMNRDRCPGLCAFCMVLYKLSWPRRLCDFREIFGGTKQRCGRIVNYVTVFLYKRFSAKMNGLDRERYTDKYLLQLCEVGYEKNGLMENIWGFIDATIRPCARPVRYQQVMYNGKNKVHAIKFQSVVAWDGMIAHVAGPWAGTRHDSGIFAESGLPELMASLPGVALPGIPYPIPVALYGDEGYAISNRLFVPYPDGRVDSVHAAFNHTMSQSRIQVEWGYHMILKSWTALDFKRNLKLFKSPIGAYYIIAALLTNVLSCLNESNEITLYSGGATPSVEAYLRTLASE